MEKNTQITNKNGFNPAKLNKLTLIIGGLAGGLILLAVVFYGDIKLNNIADEAPTFEKVVRQYFDIKDGLKKELNKRFIEESENQDLGINHSNNPLYIKTVFAGGGSLTKGELIARGIATFLEIGRDKDVTNARRINAEDLTYIYTAKDNLKDVYQEAFIVSRSQQWNDENIENFFELLLSQYENMDNFLDELILYKKFHGTELAAVKLGKIAEFSEKQIKILEDLVKLSNDAERLDYFKNIADEVTNILESSNDALEESVEGLKKVKVPENISGREILEDRLRLRIAIYEVIIKANKKSIENSDNLFSGGDDASGIADLQNQMKQNLSRYKSESRLGTIFKDIIVVDNDLKIKAESFKERFNILFFIEDDIYLEDLLAQFYRHEKTEIEKRIEKLQEDSKKITSLGRTGLEFVVRPYHLRITVSLSLWESIEIEDVSLTLKTPSGKIINKDIAKETAGVRFSSLWGYIEYIIDSPAVGTWYAQAEGPSGVKIKITASADSRDEMSSGEWRSSCNNYPNSPVGLARIGYFEKDSEIYFHNEFDDLIVVNADWASFECLVASNNITGGISGKYYAKDANSVYANGELLEGADVGTFKFMTFSSSPGVSNLPVRYYAKDKNSVYVNQTKLPNSDPETWVEVYSNAYGYSKDKNNVYLFDQIMIGADGATFERLEKGDYYKDKNSVYFKNTVLEGADPNTFVVLWRDSKRISYSYDKAHYYKNDAVIGDGSSPDFQVLNDTYLLNKNHLLWRNNDILITNPQNLEYIAAGYLKDDINVYSTDRKPVGIVEDILPSQFDIYISSNFSSDSDWDYANYYARKGDTITVVYSGFMQILERQLEGVDANTFQLISWPYAKDKQSVFFESKKLEGADPATFKLTSEKLSEQYSMDKNYVYYGSKKLEDANTDSFRAQKFEGIYAPLGIDDNSVYYKVQKLEGINPLSVTVEKNGLIIRDVDTAWYETCGPGYGSIRYIPESEVPDPVNYTVPPYC